MNKKNIKSSKKRSEQNETSPYVSVSGHGFSISPPSWIRKEAAAIDYLRILTLELADYAREFDYGERKEWRGEITAHEVVPNRWNIDEKKIIEVTNIFKRRTIKFSREKKLLVLLKDLYYDHYLSKFFKQTRGR